MTQRIVAIVGISGCGKTAFIKNLAEIISFQHLSAGSMIAKQKNLHEVKRDQLRLEDVSDNQSLLVQGFRRTKDRNSDLVVLDGHVVIQSAEDLEAIDAKVFSEMGITAFVHLFAPPERITANRVIDRTRKRPIIDIAQAQSDQEFSIEVATKISELLKLPILIADVSDLARVSDFLLRLDVDSLSTNES